jgi:hypothetical protein
VDRLTPRLRPDRAIAGYQRWRDLLFLHWELPVEALRAVVPPALELDLYEGRAYVGLVPFTMHGVRPAWVPERFGMNFPETNVRTYVHVRGRDPGVFFFSLDAASRLAVWGARVGWGLPYFHASMTVARERNRIDYAVERHAPARPQLTLQYEVGEPLPTAEPGSLDFFLCERYLLHVQRGSQVYTGQIHHQPYPLRTARVTTLQDSLVRAAGLPEPHGEPIVHYASGVDVEIFNLRPATTDP